MRPIIPFRYRSSDTKQSYFTQKNNVLHNSQKLLNFVIKN